MPRTAASAIAAKQAGEAIRAARQAAGLTQAELGRRLRSSASYVANVEAGRENLTVGQLANFASAMGAALELAFPRPTRERVRVRDAASVRR
jgi:transcriptional regulator with XRE-family HTH domain